MNFIIKNYVNKLQNEDIIKFGLENDILISNEEANYLCQITKNNLEVLLNTNADDILKDIEDRLGKEKGEKIKNLFLECKEKYKDYL